MHIMHNPLDTVASCLVEIVEDGAWSFKNGENPSLTSSGREIIICIIFLELPGFLESSLTYLE